MLVNSIPIYFGNKKIDKDFNEKCFINYHNFKNIKSLIQHIIKVDKDDKLYEEYLKQPIFKSKKQYYLSKSKRVENRLNEIIEGNDKK